MADYRESCNENVDHEGCNEIVDRESSNEVADCECTLCQDNNIRAERVGYCEECQEHLCSNCVRTHRKIKATSQHRIVQGSRLAKVSLHGSSKDHGYPRYNLLSEDLKDRKIKKVGKYNVKERSDEEKSSITGSAFLDDDTFLICDYGNNKVKHVSRDMKIMSSIVLPEGPFDITLTSPQEAVVTLSALRQLQYLTVKPKLKLDRTVDLDKDCWGITNHNNNLYVSCGLYPGEVLVVDQTGRVVKNYGNHGNGSNMLEWPQYVTVGNNGVMYVSDFDTGTITGLSQDGETVYKYNNENLKATQQLLVDSGHYVYVCGCALDNILILTPKGQLYRELIKEGEGLRSPMSMAYRASDNTLVVGMKDDNIMVYRFVK